MATIYKVTGMTCDHCVAAVSSEVAAVPGVESVDVDLPTGYLSVAGAGFTEEQIREAVTEAGYEMSTI